MKKQLELFCLILCFTLTGFSQTTYTWTAATNTNANVAANWNPSTGIPGANSLDNVVFDGSATADCNWNINSINSFSVLSGYTGNIDMGTTGRIINGNLVINSGSVLATSADLEFLGTGSSNFVLSGTGIFNDNNSNVNVSVQSGQVFTFSGSIVLKQLTIQGSSTSSREINFGSNLVLDNLIMDVGSKVHSYQGTVHIKNSLDMSNLGNVTYVTVPLNNTATFIFDGVNALIEGVSNSTRGPLPNIEINTTGTYTITNNLNVYGNWTGTQGTLTVGSSTENFYGTAAVTGTAAAFDNLTIQTGATVNMPSNAEVKVGGALVNSGTLNFQTTTALGLNAPGSTSQSLAGGFTLAGLKAYGTGSSRNVTITGSMINILDSLKIGANITFNTGGFITLKSSNSLTARVAEKPGTSSITGNVTVETFIPGGTTGWANLGVRGVTGQTFADWDTYVSSGATTGIPMSCTGCVYSPTVIGTGSSSFVSVQGWDENTNNYTELTASDPLTAGSGFWVYVGDGVSTTNGLKLINSGSLVQNNVNITVSTSGTNAAHFNLVSNPYACPISWSKVIADGSNALSVSDVIYVYNADISATTSYVGATNASSHGSGGITDVIPGGQGFYIEALSTGFGNLAINETMKTFSVTGNTSSNPLLRESGISKPVQLFRLKVKGSSDWDETAFVTYPDATNGFDKKFDARKFFQSPGYSGYPGVYTKYTTISSRDAFNEDYSINTVAPLSTSLSIPVLVKVSTSGTYTISAKDFQNFNTCVGLIDKLDNSYHDLRANPYVCSINDTTSAPRFELVLCRDPYVDLVSVPELENSGSILINQDQQGAYVKTVFTQNTKAVISAYNILGQKLMSDFTVEGLVTTTRLNLDLHNQVAIIKVTTDKETSTKKIVLH